MAEPAADRLLDLPDSGRRFVTTRPARFGDLSPGGRLRLDAIARYVQDVASDDTTDAGLENDMAWVARRTAVELRTTPTFREPLTLTTFCSGYGGRWAERRVSIVGERVASIETVSLWVHLDADSGRPVPLPDDFHQIYGEAAAGRVVSARLQHPAEVPPDAARRPWALRFTDFDLLGHVNNAATWAMVEEALVARRHLRPPLRAELEYRLPIEQGDEVELATLDHPDGSLSIWMTEPGSAGLDAPRLYATATVSGLPG
ncbi:MAG: acyl-[acyl-carrier-protein] thioesterase [Acidimicrobiales bacterium]